MVQRLKFASASNGDFGGLVPDADGGYVSYKDALAMVAEERKRCIHVANERLAVNIAFQKIIAHDDKKSAQVSAQIVEALLIEQRLVDPTLYVPKDSVFIAGLHDQPLYADNFDIHSLEG
jgi:hypothetical protein